VHDYIKYLKFGYGKVSDHVARDIRLKRRSRAEGIKLIKEYLPVKPEALAVFLDWIEISEKEFYSYIDCFRDKNAWKKDTLGNWSCQNSPANQDIKNMTGEELQVTDPRSYLETPVLETQHYRDPYILLGRSYIDETNFKAIEG